MNGLPSNARRASLRPANPRKSLHTASRIIGATLPVTIASTITAKRCAIMPRHFRRLRFTTFVSIPPPLICPSRRPHADSWRDIPYLLQQVGAGENVEKSSGGLPPCGGAPRPGKPWAVPALRMPGLPWHLVGLRLCPRAGRREDITGREGSMRYNPPYSHCKALVWLLWLFFQSKSPMFLETALMNCCTHLLAVS